MNAFKMKNSMVDHKLNNTLAFTPYHEFAIG